MAGDDKGRRMTPCRCASHSLKYEPATERAPDEKFVSRFVSESADDYEARVAGIYTRLSKHESGHVIAALAYGRQVEYATLANGAPHTCYIKRIGERTVDAFATVHVAGMIAEGADLPSWAELGPAIRRARAGVKGHCDLCLLSDLVVACAPDLPDREHINLIYDCLETTARLFQSPSWSGALDALASELEAKTLLTGDDITRITSTFDLTGPLETVKPIWTKHHEN